METFYFFESGGKSRNLSDMGVGGVSLSLMNQGDDVLSFRRGGDFAENEAFHYLQRVKFLKSVVSQGKVEKTYIFSGVCLGPKREGAGNNEGVSYSFAGPWWELSHRIFCQSWKFGVATGETVLPDGESGAENGEGQAVFAPGNVESSRLTLGYDLQGNRINAGKIIKEVIDFAAAKGTGIRGGDFSSDLDIMIPTEEVEELSCAEVISRVLRWFPGLVVAFDYSGSDGVPIINILGESEGKKRVWTIGKDLISWVNLVPRYDLRPPCVRIQYTIENSGVDADGHSSNWRCEVVDKFPENASGDELGALRFVVPLEGSQSREMKQKIKVGDVLPNSPDWWKKKVKWLNDIRLKWLRVKGSSSPGEKFILHSETVEILDNNGSKFTDGAFSEIYGEYNQEIIPRELISGGVADWMKDEEKNEIKSIPATVKANISFLFVDKDSSGTISANKVVREQISVKVNLTNAFTRTYKKNEVTQVAEAVPTGLAEKFFKQLSRLRYDGSVSLVSGEPDGGAVRIGDVVNLRGGREEWATMGAVVQGVSFDFDSGKTQVSLGSPRWLSPPDWISFFRQNRGRRPAENAAAKRKDAKGDGDDDGAEVPSFDHAVPLAVGAGAEVLKKINDVVIRNTVQAKRWGYEVVSSELETSGAAAMGAMAAPGAGVTTMAEGVTPGPDDNDGVEGTADVVSGVTVETEDDLVSAFVHTGETGKSCRLRAAELKKDMHYRTLEIPIEGTVYGTAGTYIVADFIMSDPEYRTSYTPFAY